jgi:hypothetical protein
MHVPQLAYETWYYSLAWVASFAASAKAHDLEQTSNTASLLLHLLP